MDHHVNTPTACVGKPAYAYVAAHGNLLTQLGASKVEAVDPTTIVASFNDGARAANASALLADTVRGAKLVVADTSGSDRCVAPSAAGIADLLRGVDRLQVYEAAGATRGSAEIYTVAPDKTARDTLRGRS